MTKVVYKYPLEFCPQIIKMPQGAELLTVQLQHGEPQLWALVDPEKQIEKRQIRIVGTGHDISENVRYIATFQLYSGSLVFHAFEII